MKKIAGRLAIGVGVFLGILVVAIIGLFFAGRSKLNRTYEISVTQINIPSDEETLARGEHLVNTVSDCIGCHGENLEGDLVSDDPALGVLYAPNLTSGQGGVGATYSDADWIKALRHGVRGDGQAMLIMPSQNYTEYSSEDLGAVIAYLKTVPPVDNQTPERKSGFLLNILLALGAFPTAYELIDQDGTWEDSRSAVVNEETGAYLATISGCRDCHGDNLSGRVDETGAPPGPNLTPGGNLQTWTYEGFAQALREGITPTGQPIADTMPWRAYSGMSDDELRSIWLYLQSLPALETASQ